MELDTAAVLPAAANNGRAASNITATLQCYCQSTVIAPENLAFSSASCSPPPTLAPSSTSQSVDCQDNNTSGGNDGLESIDVLSPHRAPLTLSPTKDCRHGDLIPSTITTVEVITPPLTPVGKPLLPFRSLTIITMAAELHPSAARDSPGSPNSPPELTDSKSSKSSSFHSSGLADSASCDLSHFEDISLEDFDRAYPKKSHGPGKRSLPTSASRSMSSTIFYPQREPASRSFRDLTSTSNATIITKIGGLASVRSQSVGLPLPISGHRSPRHRVSAPRKPFLALAGPGTKRSRSSSPTSDAMSPPGYCPSPRSTRTGSSSSGNFSGASSFAKEIRQSWNLGRKTVKELEDEYHDSDEELPDDAIVWNVPISPRPPHERDFSASLSRAETDPTPLPLNRQQSLPSAATSEISSPKLSSESPTSVEYPRPLQSKSWDVAMSDLSSEARELTQALEMYAEESERSQEQQIQNGNASPVKKRKTAIVVELPPLRRGELIIDPLPISKEKEKVLTRTRPSWLPPKNPKEEKKHLKEYQRMMAYAADAEKRKAEKMHAQQCVKDSSLLSMSKAWEDHILPNWNEAILELRTRELWWKGVPPRSRGSAWQKAAGNELALTEASFNAALTRAKEMEARLKKLSPEEEERDDAGKIFARLRADVATVFSELNIFQTGGPLHQSLLDVCRAYSMYKVDFRYVSGVHALAALLLLNLSPATSFVALANILNRPLAAAILNHDAATLTSTYTLFLSTLAYKLPQLYTHLASASFGLSPETYLTKLFESLFCSNLVGLDIATRIWDVAVFEGDGALVRAAVAVFSKLEGKLYGEADEVLEVLARREIKLELGSTDEFITCMRQMGNVDGEQQQEKKRLRMW